MPRPNLHITANLNDRRVRKVHLLWPSVGLRSCSAVKKISVQHGFILSLRPSILPPAPTAGDRRAAEECDWCSLERISLWDGGGDGEGRLLWVRNTEDFVGFWWTGLLEARPFAIVLHENKQSSRNPALVQQAGGTAPQQNFVGSNHVSSFQDFQFRCLRLHLIIRLKQHFPFNSSPSVLQDPVMKQISTCRTRTLKVDVFWFLQKICCILISQNVQKNKPSVT